MKILLSWLKDYIDIEQSPLEIAKILTMAGLEVDAIENLAPNCENVVIAKVIDVQKHPQADKLCLATVSDGTQQHQVVCGAPNCRPGLKTAFAPIGATVFDEEKKPFKIKKSKIRGVESSGMLCAFDELGLPGNHEGIIEFSEEVIEGTDVRSLYEDTVFEISLTPNLGHCASVMGVARELGAAIGKKVRYPSTSVKEIATPIASLASVEIAASTDCPRYACRVIQGIQMGPSPEWLKKRIEASGMRSINNIVDATNYVMLEMGQPLHAFDYDRLDGHRIIVRQSNQELFTTLDDKERQLQNNDLLICDADKPVALAGVMGGGNSEVNEETKNLLLEAACFSPTTIRRTSKRLGLMTDASKRFERGTDPNGVTQALDRLADIIQQVAGGQVAKGIIDISSQSFPKRTVKCRLSRTNEILGTKLSAGEVEGIFSRLEFIPTWDNQDTFSVVVPTYRNDIHTEIDLIEEVARIYGFDNISKPNCAFSTSELPHVPMFLFEREMRSRLVQSGLQEFLTCDLIGPTLLDIAGEAEMPEKARIKVLNPTSIEQSILRTSLLPGLLQVVKYNWDHQNHDVSGFEIGRIHFKEGERYIEQSVMGIILSGKSTPYHWDSKPRQADFYDLKGSVENILAELKVADVAFKPSHSKVLHPGRQASLWVGNKEIGTLGEIHPEVQRKLDVPQRILFAEINLQELIQVRGAETRMQLLPIYPGSERDWTVTLEEQIPMAALFDAIKMAKVPLLESVSLLDVYRSDKLGAGLKNITFRFVYRDKNKTIEQDKVDAAHANLLEKVSKSIKSKI